jgi:uncharacterized membrane-anchored protein YitT (DUF2179 family)
MLAVPNATRAALYGRKYHVASLEGTVPMLEQLNISISWRYLVSRVILLTGGGIIIALSVVIFLVPADIVPAGATGFATILNELIGTPIGLVVILLNIPVQLLGFRMLNGWHTTLSTVYATVLYSLLIDLLPLLAMIPQDGVSDDLLLNALFGGILAGVGSGLVFRAGGTAGGTATLARILRRLIGTGIGVSSLFTDGLIILGAGVVFGWEAALYAVIALGINRSVSNYVLEGPGSTVTAFIVTKQPIGLRRAIHQQIERRVTHWSTDEPETDVNRHMLMVTLDKTEVSTLATIVSVVDEEAFVSVVQGKSAFGADFRSLGPELPLGLDTVDDGAPVNIENVRQIREDTRAS